MIIQCQVTECDITGRQYSEPVSGGQVIVAGATGRHCAVLNVGPEWIAETRATVLDPNDAREQVAARVGWAMVDF